MLRIRIHNNRGKKKRGTGTYHVLYKYLVWNYSWKKTKNNRLRVRVKFQKSASSVLVFHCLPRSVLFLLFYCTVPVPWTALGVHISRGRAGSWAAAPGPPPSHTPARTASSPRPRWRTRRPCGGYCASTWHRSQGRTGLVSPVYRNVASSQLGKI